MQLIKKFYSMKTIEYETMPFMQMAKHNSQVFDGS